MDNPNMIKTEIKLAKEIIHSTRSWKEMKEGEIRAYFRSHRPGIKTGDTDPGPVCV